MSAYQVGSNPFLGSPAEQATFARDEVGSAMIDDTQPLDSYGFEGTAGEESRASLDDGDGAEQLEYLYSLLEDALPKQTDAGRTLTAAEQQQKRDAVEHTWERVRRWLWKHPDVEDRRTAALVRGQADATPLHLMCKLPNPPPDVIAAIVEAGPEAVATVDSHGWLPLHHACANGASPDVLAILLEVHPDGKVHQDNQDRTPLHFYVTRSSDNVAAMTANAEMLSDSGAAELPDRGGMLAMHYAAAYGTHPAVLKVLAEVYPQSLSARENNGRTPLHLAMVNAHRDASPSTIRFLLDHTESKLTINARDVDGFLPLHLLALGLKGYRNDDPEKRSNVSQSLLMYLAAEPTPSADFLTAIQDLPDWLQDTAVVSKHVRNVLNEKIAQRFPTSILMLDGYLLIVLIVCFAVTTKNNIDLRLGPGDVENTTQAALVILFVGAAYFFMRELVQIASLISLGSFKSWYRDLSNWLDIAVIVMVLYYAVLMADGNAAAISDEAFRSGVALTQGLLWVAIIMFLKKTLVDFAVFVGGVFYVVQRLVAFVIAVGVILFAFAQMFFFVYIDTGMCEAIPGVQEMEVCRFAHCSFGESLLKVYTMMMGEIGDVTRYSTNLTAQIMFVFYAFLVVILLSNVLIAIVTDSYEIVQNDRAAIVFWNNRLDFIAEMDAIAYAVQRRLMFRKGDKKVVEVQEVPEGSRSKDEPIAVETADEENVDYFREGWHQIMLLFDANLYDDMDWIETWVYNIFRIICIFVVIPLWLAAGVMTAGWLWPPQVREYLFVQKETAVSRAELERQKLAQLKGIQDELKNLKQELSREMIVDRDEMVRIRMEVETIQTEVLADLQQVKELMSSLLGE